MSNIRGAIISSVIKYDWVLSFILKNVNSNDKYSSRTITVLMVILKQLGSRYRTVYVLPIAVSTLYYWCSLNHYLHNIAASDGTNNVYSPNFSNASSKPAYLISSKNCESLSSSRCCIIVLAATFNVFFC